jgi:hypothetical protein
MINGSRAGFSRKYHVWISDVKLSMRALIRT